MLLKILSSNTKFPLIAMLFPRLYSILNKFFSFSSSSSPSSSLASSQSIMKNLEEWEIVRDRNGRLVKIIIHRDVKQG
jgi:hypothetical protein